MKIFSLKNRWYPTKWMANFWIYKFQQPIEIYEHVQRYVTFVDRQFPTENGYLNTLTEKCCVIILYVILWYAYQGHHWMACKVLPTLYEKCACGAPRTWQNAVSLTSLRRDEKLHVYWSIIISIWKTFVWAFSGELASSVTISTRQLRLTLITYD